MSKEDRLNNSSPDLAPFTFVLDVPFETHFATDKENAIALETLKEQLEVVTHENPLAGNLLGAFASGLVMGRINRVKTSSPTGLYKLTENGQGITFFDPDILASQWSQVEEGVGPQLQEAMRALIGHLADPELLHFDFDVAAGRER